MFGYAAASGALSGTFPGLQWGTSLNAGQPTSDVAAATCIPNTTVLASTGGVYASEAWNTAFSSASDSVPTVVVAQRALTASAGGSAHHILPKDAGEPTVTTTADAAESSTRTRTLRILNEVLMPVFTISGEIAAAEPITLRVTSATAAASSTASTDAVAPIGVRDSEDPGLVLRHGGRRLRHVDGIGGGSGSSSTTTTPFTGSNLKPTSSLSTDDSNTVATTRPVDREPEANRCVAEGVEVPSPQGDSSGSGPGTTTMPFTGYNLKLTTTCEITNVETPPGDNTTTTTSTSTSTPRRMLTTVPITVTSPTPVPGRCISSTTRVPRKPRRAISEMPRRWRRTALLAPAPAPPQCPVPLQEGASTSHQFAITGPVTTPLPLPPTIVFPPKTSLITSDDSSSSVY
ncbi:hypothetical protein DL768_006298 [Monosporascus sp. mg162]|nr:hypothetical protein DL768_006298 [Monosporascus sp. mg162]